MALRLLLLASLLVQGAHATDHLTVSFDRTPLGDYLFDSCKAQFPGVTWNNGLARDTGRVHVIEGGDTAWSGRSIRVSYPAGCLGPGGTGGAPACGAQWKSRFPGARDTLMARYRIFFPHGFEWTKGGKLPGLCGSKCNTGGNPPTGSDGWSARIMWRASAQLTMYLYHPGQSGTYGTDLVWKDSTGKALAVPTGRWHELVTRICLNTPGKDGAPGLSDGRVQAWFDGHPAIDTSGLRFRDRDTMHIDQFYFSTFFGGSTSDFSPAHDNRIFFDDFLVADSIPPALPVGAKHPKRATKPQVHIRNGSLSWDGEPGDRLVLSSMDGRILASRQFPGAPAPIDLPVRGIVAWTTTRGPASGSGILVLP